MTDKAKSPETKPKRGAKQQALLELLERKTGATITELAEATGWQPHTVRGAIAGVLKKRLGLNVTSEKIDGRGRVYKIEGGTA